VTGINSRGPSEIGLIHVGICLRCGDGRLDLVVPESMLVILEKVKWNIYDEFEEYVFGPETETEPAVEEELQKQRDYLWNVWGQWWNI